MAKLLSYYNLCPINDVREFLGLSRDVDTGCAINTLGRNIIQVVKVSSFELPNLPTAKFTMPFVPVEQSETPAQLDIAGTTDQQGGVRFPLGTLRGCFRQSPSALLEQRSDRYKQGEKSEVLSEHFGTFHGG